VLRHDAGSARRRTIRGFVGGFGVQLIDPVGVRVVPEVRYTRWAGRSFDAFSTHTNSTRSKP